MWNVPSHRIFPKQVDGIAGQADPIYLMLQAVLIQTHNRLILFAGKGFDPGASLKALLCLPGEDRLGPVYRHPKGFIQHPRVVGAHRLGPAEHLGSLPPALALLTELDVGLRFFGPDRGSGYGETRYDGVGNPAARADTAQDP